MKKILAFTIGAFTVFSLLVLAVFFSMLLLIISTVLNGGHPWPHNVWWWVGIFPPIFFCIFTTVAAWFFLHIPLLKKFLKEILFYLGIMFGAGTFMVCLGYIIHIGRAMHCAG
ncbi:MAG: hypothetical protein IJV89_00125 [Lentisphaeria bacterium]|nr:hypothetical protein [Lentisphaeria bacterium]